MGGGAVPIIGFWALNLAGCCWGGCIGGLGGPLGLGAPCACPSTACAKGAAPPADPPVPDDFTPLPGAALCPALEGSITEPLAVPDIEDREFATEAMGSRQAHRAPIGVGRELITASLVKGAWCRRGAEITQHAGHAGRTRRNAGRGIGVFQHRGVRLRRQGT